MNFTVFCDFDGYMCNIVRFLEDTAIWGRLHFKYSIPAPVLTNPLHLVFLWLI